MGRVTQRELVVHGQPARVHVGGEGEPLLLVHGGWGGAASHWAPIWEQLAERFLVVAPELPGVGWPEQGGLGGADAYVRWLLGVLDGLGLPAAWCVGNSAGSALVWALAAHHPGRCRGLVLVNGGPLPRTPGWLRALGTRPLARGLMKGLYRRGVFSPQAQDQAFAVPRDIPAELQAIFRHPSPPQLDALFDALLQGGDGAVPSARTLLVWGEADRLAGSDVRAARRLQARLPGAQLVVIPRAGHLPQVENPRAVVDALVAFATGGGAAAGTPASP